MGSHFLPSDILTSSVLWTSCRGDLTLQPRAAQASRALDQPGDHGEALPRRDRRHRVPYVARECDQQALLTNQR